MIQTENTTPIRPDAAKILGLKKLRAQGDKPLHACSNCRCNRYSPCGCKKRSTHRKKEG